MTKIVDSSVKGMIIKARGFNEEEYADIKKALKEELSFRVTVRMWKRQYAYGQIDIQPYGKGIFNWTEEQFEEVYSFMKKHNLYSHMLYEETKASKYLLFGNGFNFVAILDSKIVKEEPKQPSNVIDLNEYRRRVGA